MRLKPCLLVSLVLLLLFSKPVLAEDASPSPKPKPWEFLQQKLEQRQEERQERLTERVRDRVQGIYNQIKERLAVRIERLGNIADRIEGRFSFFEEKGRDTSQAKSKIAEARVSLETAKTDLATVEIKLQELLVSATPKDLLPGLKDAIHQVRKDLSTARQLLAEAMNALVSQGGINED